MAIYRGSPVASAEHNRKDDTFALLNGDGEIIAVLKRHEYLSQPQLRTLRLSNGKHRRPRAAFRGSSSGQPYFTLAPGTIFRAGPGGLTWISADDAPRKPVEDAGIRAGEVIARRCWRVVDDGLHSTYMRNQLWEPGEPMTGDVRHEYGVHAFKELVDLNDYIDGLRMFSWGWLTVNWSTGEVIRPKATAIAVGTIALWGEVVEHERGYRAEFGKVISIDRVIDTDDDALLDRLRSKYVLTSSERT